MSKTSRQMSGELQLPFIIAAVKNPDELTPRPAGQQIEPQMA